jgi:two-component system response regulator YesN
MALPLLNSIRPDVLITDIKMPFMDGLQLCKIVRERMPWMKIIILSGHDEFEYAREAIKLGVTEYLLKPVTVQDMHAALQKIATQLDQEKEEQENLHRMQVQLDESRAILRERLLLKLVVGAVSSPEAIEKAEQLGLDLIARCYLVVILKTELGDRSEQFDYEEYQQVQGIISGLVENNPDIFLIKKDWQELVLLMKGNTPKFIEEERDLLIEHILQGVGKTRYRVTSGSGTPKKRLADIYQSFVEALVCIQVSSENEGTGQIIGSEELHKIDKLAVENYLRRGVREDFDDFFDAYLHPLGDVSLKSYLIKNYVFVDVVLATVKLVNELGGDLDRVIPELNSIETILSNIKTVEQLKEQVQKILNGALAFRDQQSGSQYIGMIRQAREFIDRHYANPDLSLNTVAAHVNLSPSHFSAVFSQEAGQTFKEYLTEVRINKAKELLRMTHERSTDISYEVGYNDPHYFSYVFRKATGLSPTEFRLQAIEPVKDGLVGIRAETFTAGNVENRP